MSSKHINKVLKKAVNDVLDTIKGSVTVDEINHRVIDILPANLNFEDFVITAISGEVNNQIKTRAVEKEDDSDDLFPETLGEKFISYRNEKKEKFVLKVNDAYMDHLVQYEKRQIKNFEKQKAVLERWNRRREILYPIMRENPELTVKEALEIAAYVS